MASAPAGNPNHDRLKSHFLGHDDSSHPKRWDHLWEKGDFLPWDRGCSNPALIDALQERGDLIGSPLNADGTRKRALVPGCGKGYDVVLFASHGYDAYGIEVSESAVKVAEAYVKDPGEGPLEGEYKAAEQKAGNGKGKTKCLLGDFFKDEWAEGAGGIGQGFDVIYDNTFLCALPPSLRPAWAARMAQLLAPTGRLVCLEFPTYKPPTSGGPPWALPSIVHEELLKRPGENISYESETQKPLKTDRPESDKALVKIAHWKPARTHKVAIINGEITDWVSVWKHK